MRGLWLALLVGLLSCVALAQAPQPQPDSKKPIHGDRPPGSVSVEQALSQIIPEVRLENRPLHEAVEWLRGASGVNVVVRWSRLKRVEVSEKTPITLHLKDVPLRRVLELMLDMAGPDVELGYAGEGNVLIISTQADLDRKLVVQTYEVTHLLARVPDFAGPRLTLSPPTVLHGYWYGYPGYYNFHDYYPFYDPAFFYGRPIDEVPEDDFRTPVQELIEVIVNAVEPDSWLVNGGRGTIVDFNGKLVVRNTRRVHEQLVSALHLLPVGTGPKTSPAAGQPPQPGTK